MVLNVLVKIRAVKLFNQEKALCVNKNITCRGCLLLSQQVQYNQFSNARVHSL